MAYVKAYELWPGDMLIEHNYGETFLHLVIHAKSYQYGTELTDSYVVVTAVTPAGMIEDLWYRHASRREIFR